MLQAQPTMDASAAEPETIAVPLTLENSEDKMVAGNIDLGRLPAHNHTLLNDSKRSIRLLKLHIGSGYGPLRCTLSQHDLDDTPQYVALSYTWDRGLGRKHIECNGMDLEIGENLWQFLFEFRKKQVLRQLSVDATAEIHYLWIDAICIDQSSLAERNHQVALMRDVYTKADSVIVWLGLVQGGEELAFMLARHHDLLTVVKVQTELLMFLNKPYFGRVWVVQEFVLAQAVGIWCGELAADADAFDDIWNRDKPLPGFQELSKAITTTPAWPLFKHRRNFRRTHLGESVRTSFRLRELLRSFESSQSSEVYDKVYGFLGIASDNQLVAHPIQPDYSKAPVDLLGDVLRNQYCDPSARINLDDYEFVSSLMQTLRITRIELGRYLLRQAPGLDNHIYIFIVSGFLAVSICLACKITHVGSFEHISGPFDDDVKTAVSNSCRGLPQLTAADVSKLSSPKTLSDIARGLNFEELSRNHPLLRNKILRSMHSIMQNLLASESEGHTSRADHSDTDLRQKFARSFNRTTSTKNTTQYSPNWYRKYAVFKGTNDQIGVLCADGNYEQASEASIYLFAGNDNSRNGLLVQQRNRAELIIVGSAIISSSIPKPYLSNIVQPLPSIYRKDEPTRKSSYPPAETRLDTATCFHCHIIELLELGRCGILDELQLNQILERSLRGSANDEVHRCGMGTSQCPSLEFETNTRVDR